MARNEKVSAGRLRHHIFFVKPSTQQDDGGGSTRSYTVVGDAWANVDAASAGEVFQAAQTKTWVTHSIECRYREIDPSWMIQFGTRMFAIHGSRIIDERKRLMVLPCEEMAAMSE